MSTWFPVGKQKIIPTYGKHFSVKLTGVLDYETGKVHVEESDSFNAEVFLSFLHRILKLYPSGKIVMILDNARVHHAKLLNPFLKENPRLELCFLPPYSPQLNQIEGLWKWLKEACINNVFFSKMYQIKQSVRSFIQWIDTVPEQVIDRLCL